MLPTRTAAVSDAAVVGEGVPGPGPEAEAAGVVAGATVRVATTGTAAAIVRQPWQQDLLQHSPLRPTATTLRGAARATAVRATAVVTAGGATVAAAISRRAENRPRRHKPKNPRNF